MNVTKHEPVSVGEMLIEEFIKPHGLTQEQLAQAMGVTRKTVNELCNDKRSITAETALMLATVFGNTPEFLLNLQHRNDIWKVMNTPKRHSKIARAMPLRHALGF